MLEEDDTLATEATGEEDQDGTGLEALPELGGTESLADFLGLRLVIDRVPFLFSSRRRHTR